MTLQYEPWQVNINQLDRWTAGTERWLKFTFVQVKVMKRTMSDIPACCSWPPAAAPGDGRSLGPPVGCLSVCAPSPTAPYAGLIQPYHRPRRLLHRVWRCAEEIRRWTRITSFNYQHQTAISELISYFLKNKHQHSNICVQTASSYIIIYCFDSDIWFMHML